MIQTLLPKHLVKTRSSVLMMTPAILLLIMFVGEPFILSIMISVTNLRLGSPLPLEFVGLQQYFDIFSDQAFQRAIVNNGIFALCVVPIQTALALSLALLLNQKIYGRALFRLLFFMPVIFPLSLVAVIWIIIYAPNPEGLVNASLNTLTLGHWQARDFLHHEFFALPAIMLTSIWQGVGFQMIVFLAALQAIPHHLYEAASIDGAKPWQQFWHITLPQLRYTVVYVVILTTILAFRLFDQVQIMTQGGPNNASTTIMFEVVKNAFTQQQVAKAAAMTVVLFMLVLFLTFLQQKISKKVRV